MHVLVSGTARRFGLCLLAAALLAGCDSSLDPARPDTGTAAPAAQQSWLSGHVDIGVKNDQPGLNLKSNYSNTGFDVDLAKFLAEKIGFTPNFIDIPSSARETSLMSGKVKLVIASYSITPARLEKVDFAGPYLKTQQALLVRADEDRFALPKDVAKKHICTAEGSTSAAGMTSSSLPTPDALLAGSLYSVPDYSTCVNDLRNQRADAVYTDATVLHGFTQLYPNQLKVLPMTFGSVNYYGVGIAKGHPDDCRTLMRYVKEFIRDEWIPHLKDNLASIEAADPVRYVNEYRPGEAEVDQYSRCD